MPSAEEASYLFDVIPNASLAGQNSFTSRDVDVLVSRIKENLRLSGLKSRSSLDQKIRPSPYQLPSRPWSESSDCELCSKRNNSLSDTDNSTVVLSKENHQHRHYTRKRLGRPPTDKLQDSYERFEALLRRGALIKEAVKRLQTSPDVDYDVLDVVGDVDTDETCPSSYSATVDSMEDD